MTKIVKYESEHIEATLRRFKRSVERSGVLKQLRDKECYEKPSIVNKKNKAAAIKRLKRRLLESELPTKKY